MKLIWGSDSKNAHRSHALTMNRLHRLDTLIAWYGEFLQINSYRPRTVKDYLFEVSFFRRYLEQNTELRDIDELDAQALRNFTGWLYDRACMPRTIHHKLAALRTFFITIYEEHKLYVNLSEALIMPRIGKTLPTNTLTEQEVRSVFAYLESRIERVATLPLDRSLAIRDRALFEILYSSGIRRNELISLRLGDINAADGLIIIHSGKGGKDRVVPIGRTGIEAIDAYIKHARCKLTGMWTKDELFLNRWGNSLGPEGVRDIVNRLIERSGIKKHIRVHDMRHTCATHMLNNGADIRFVQEQLGHASLSSTQVYTHVSINKLKETHRKYHPRERQDDTNQEEASHGSGTDS